MLATKEPRLKGSFSELNKTYSEIIFVLQQIIDKLHNVAFLRRQYGSSLSYLNVSVSCGWFTTINHSRLSIFTGGKSTAARQLHFEQSKFLYETKFQCPNICRVPESLI